MTSTSASFRLHFEQVKDKRRKAKALEDSLTEIRECSLGDLDSSLIEVALSVKHGVEKVNTLGAALSNVPEIMKASYKDTVLDIVLKALQLEYSVDDQRRIAKYLGHKERSGWLTTSIPVSASQVMLEL